MEDVHAIEEYRSTDLEVIEERNCLPAVCVRNAWKSYGSKKYANHVLKGLNLTVKPGHIYALLGASGCGKTTLLSCIVARKKFDVGEIAVYGYEPGTPESGIPGWRLGYMPQHVALYKECTIQEVCFFFGRIYGMNGKLIRERMEFYRDLLQMPESTRIVGSLSGGQQRRVSFAVSLLNNPQLLVLDEPTVGVDPILRQKIWDYLQSLTKSADHTIVITTHYIEEARQANMVGMMYEGQVLVEEVPTILLQKHSCTRLEDVFYDYCVDANAKMKGSCPSNEKRKSMAHIGARNSVQLIKKNTGTYTMSISERIKNSLNRSLTIYWKTFRRMIHMWITFLFVVSVPPLTAFSFCVGLTEQFKDLSLGVYNGEYPSEPWCNSFPGECFFGNLSCLYLDNMDRDMFNLVSYSSQKEAYSGVVKREVKAALTFPSNFSDSLQVRFSSGTSATDKGSVKNSRISVVIDKSDMFLSIFMQKYILDQYLLFIKSLFDSCEVDSTIADMPVDVSDPFPENKDSSLQTHFVGPMMVIITFFNTAFIGIVLFSKDRTEGVLDRISVAGVTPLEFIAALQLNAITVMATQVFTTFVTVFPIFGLPFYGGIISIFVINILQGIAGCVYGFLIAVLIPDMKAAVLAAMSLFYVSLTFGGVLWPIEALPYFVRYSNYLVPLSESISTVRLLMTREWSFTSPLIWHGFAITVGWIALIFALTVVVVQKFQKL